MSDVKLKPCPFCGAVPSVEKIFLTNEIYIICSKCKIEQPLYKTFEMAAEAWNKRTEAIECNKAEKFGDYCSGYQKGENDDEPIRVCENCIHYGGNNEGED